PTNDELKQVYIIYELFSRMGKGNEIDFALVIDSISTDTPQQYELVDNYYRMLFTAVGNKTKPFNLSKINLDLNAYKLADDTERGILFFRCMQLCGANIWGFMNIPKPPNTEAALKLIKLFPKINGQPYYHFTNFDFKDFEMVITAKEGKQSYKKYFLDKYYETLLAHYACLQNEDASEKEKNNLLLSSILKDKELYRYSKQQRTLERLFLELK
ncbi:MAG: hypothetical protein MUC81_14255, partial [Bacteroidia bacterium]|nr:hypothetical protein [Bacteroidia bacterium]